MTQNKHLHITIEIKDTTPRDPPDKSWVEFEKGVTLPNSPEAAPDISNIKFDHVLGPTWQRFEEKLFSLTGKISGGIKSLFGQASTQEAGTIQPAPLDETVHFIQEPTLDDVHGLNIRK